MLGLTGNRCCSAIPTVEVFLYLMQKVAELVQTLTRHLAVECAIGANVSHSDISVHGINLEQRTHQGCLRRVQLLPTWEDLVH